MGCGGRWGVLGEGAGVGKEFWFGFFWWGLGSVEDWRGAGAPRKDEGVGLTFFLVVIMTIL